MEVQEVPDVPQGGPRKKKLRRLSKYVPRMQFIVLLVLVAVLLRGGDASELEELTQELQQKTQQVIDEANEAAVNIIADHFPELNREEMHERRLLPTYTKYL